MFDLNVKNKLCKQFNQTFLRDLGYHLWHVSSWFKPSLHLFLFIPNQTGKEKRRYSFELLKAKDAENVSIGHDECPEYIVMEGWI